MILIVFLVNLALYLGEIVRLIIVDLVQRSILFPGRMQKSPSIRPDYNIFLILRGLLIVLLVKNRFSYIARLYSGSFYAKHVADIECDTSNSTSFSRS